MSQSFSLYKFERPHLDYDADCNAAGKAKAVSPFNSLQPGIPTEAAIKHFDVLLEAVAVRLTLASGDARTEAIITTPEEALQRLRATVLQCVEALEQLQATQRYLRGASDGPGARAETR